MTRCRALRPASIALAVCLLLTACEDESCKEEWVNFLLGPDWGPVYRLDFLLGPGFEPVSQDFLIGTNSTLGVYGVATHRDINFKRLPLVKIESRPSPRVGYYSFGSALYDVLFGTRGSSGQSDFVENFFYDDPFVILQGTERIARLNTRDGTYEVLSDGLPASGFLGAVWACPDHSIRVWFNAGGSSGTGSYELAPGSTKFVPKFVPTQTNSQFWSQKVTFEPPNNVFLAHFGDGVSYSTNCGATFMTLNIGNQLPEVVNDIRSTWSVAYKAGNLGFQRMDPPLSPWRYAVSGLTAGIGTAVAALGNNVFYANVGSDGWAHVFKSVNRGQDFVEMSTGLHTKRVNDLVYTLDGDVWAATQAGVYYLQNGASAWLDECYGMGGSWVTSVWAPPISADAPRALAGGLPLLAGTSGNSANGVFRSTDGGRSYTASSSNLDGRNVNAFATSGGTFLAASPDGIYRSPDAATWTLVPAGTAGIPIPSPSSLLAVGGSVLLAVNATPGVVRSTDAGATWGPVSGITSGGVYSLAASGSTVYAGSSFALYKSTDGGASWAKTSPPDTSAGYAVYSVAVAPDAVYAGVLDFSAGLKNTVMRSTDGGSSWTPRSTGLPTGSLVTALLPAGGALFAGTATGLYRSADSGVTWTLYEPHLLNTQVVSLAADASTVYVGTFNRGLWPLPLRPHADRLVSIVLDVATAQAHFTTELDLANRGTSTADVSLRYTASIGTKEGSGVVHETLAAGRQLVIPDVISYLRGKGLAIPAGGPQGGTLLVSFDGISDPNAVGVTARTATATVSPQPVGRAGLAYSGIDPRSGATASLTVYGLRSTPSDRSNLAVFNTSAEPVTLKVTAFSGASEGSAKVIDPGLTLPPYGWFQYNGILVTAGFTNGYVTIERTSATGAFSGYGVVNDQGTSDGSYLLPNDLVNVLTYVNVPVLVEAGAFVSELVLANSGPHPADLELVYRESLTPGSGAGGTIHVALAAGEQKIIPGAIGFLRTQGVTIGPKGGSYAGSLHVVAHGALIADIHASARTASQSGAGGQFGLFTPGVYAGGEAALEAYLYGLHADDSNRTNVAVINTGEADAGPVTLELQAFDGDAGGAAKGTAETVTLQAGEWHQLNNLLASKGVRNGWVRVRRTAGTAYWIAYAVVNDGAGPGQRTGDGAFVPAVR